MLTTAGMTVKDLQSAVMMALSMGSIAGVWSNEEEIMRTCGFLDYLYANLSLRMGPNAPKLMWGRPVFPELIADASTG